MQRRTFLKYGSAAAAAVVTGMSGLATAELPADALPLDQRLCLFTDHLDHFGYSYSDVAKMLQPLKITGPDLTVRGGGLVPPERASEELPKAAAAFRDAGMTIPMLTTNLTSASDPTAAPIFEAMGKLGIRYYKLGYYHYHDLTHWQADLASQRKELSGLLELGRRSGVVAG